MRDIRIQGWDDATIISRFAWKSIAFAYLPAVLPVLSCVLPALRGFVTVTREFPTKTLGGTSVYMSCKCGSSARMRMMDLPKRYPSGFKMAF